MLALGVASDESIPVIRQWEGDQTEDGGGVRKAAGGGAEIEELCAGIVALEEAGDSEVGVELLNV